MFPQEASRCVSVNGEDALAFLLPASKCHERKTLVLDLDHTLIDCIREVETSDVQPDHIYTDCVGVRGKVFYRPFLQEFLEAVSPFFEMVLFTAAGARHADAVLARLDPERKYFEHRLYAEHTLASTDWSHVKDLTRLGRDLSKTLLVDDCPVPAANFPSANLLNVVPFYHGQTNDTTLQELAAFLLCEVIPARDVREVLAGLRMPRDDESDSLECESPVPEDAQSVHQWITTRRVSTLSAPACVQHSVSNQSIPDIASYSLATRSSTKRRSVDDRKLPNDCPTQPMLPCSGLDALLHSPKGVIKSPSVLADLFGLPEYEEEEDAQGHEKLQRSETAEWMQLLQVLSPGKISGVVLSPFMEQQPEKPDFGYSSGQNSLDGPASLASKLSSKDRLDMLIHVWEDHGDDSETDLDDDDHLAALMKSNQSLTGFRKVVSTDSSLFSSMSLDQPRNSYLESSMRGASAKQSPSFGSLI